MGWLSYLLIERQARWCALHKIAVYVNGATFRFVDTLVL